MLAALKRVEPSAVIEAVAPGGYLVMERPMAGLGHGVNAPWQRSESPVPWSGIMWRKRASSPTGSLGRPVCEGRQRAWE